MKFSGEITSRRRGNAGGSNDSSHRHILSVDPSSKEGDFITSLLPVDIFVEPLLGEDEEEEERVFYFFF